MAEEQVKIMHARAVVLANNGYNSANTGVETGTLRVSGGELEIYSGSAWTVVGTQT